MTIPYTPQFYAHRDANTRQAAQTILPLLLAQCPPIKSAVDLGCGVGTWLSVLKEQGVSEIHGFDGEWVDPNLLVIPRDCFTHTDLSRVQVPLKTHYDLAISLEVAEHLPPDAATAFVMALVLLADTVLFSAAIPGQGGTGHVNEQWPSYWIERFASMGYEAQDWIRPQIWHDTAIPVWYRQNILVFVKQERVRRLPTLEGALPPLDLVHPELYLSKASPGVKGCWRMLRQALRRYCFS